MKSFCKMFLVILIVFVLTGCYQVNSRIRINKDGSGEIEETVLFNPNIFGMNLMSDPDSKTNFHDPEELKKQALNYGKDVKYKSSKLIEKNETVGYKVIYSFEDISKIRIDESFSDKIMGDELSNIGGTKEKTDNYITFGFKKGNTPRLMVKFPRPATKEDEDPGIKKQKEMSDEEFEMMSMMMQDLKFSLMIEVEGKIKKTDAKHQNGSEIILLDVDFAELIKDKGKFKKFAMMQENSSTQIFDYLQKNYPEIKYETSDEIFIEFK